ncbi:MAG: phage holin family protein [Pseudomonadota bacterium]
MNKLLIKWIVLTLTVLAIPHLISGIQIDSVGTALALALVLGLLNIILKPILILVTFPFTLLTFGLFLFVINGLVFWMSAQTVSGVEVHSFGSAILASLIVSLVNSLFSLSVKRDEGRIRFRFVNKPIDLEKDSSGRWT